MASASWLSTFDQDTQSRDATTYFHHVCTSDVPIAVLAACAGEACLGALADIDSPCFFKFANVRGCLLDKPLTLTRNERLLSP
jgi:hypothetical protein